LLRAPYSLPVEWSFDYAEGMASPPSNSLSNLQDVGLIIVDHGSRREESNRLLLDVVLQFVEATEAAIVEPAHMELAEPSIATAFARCVARGATMVVVFPYFLLPGRHWNEDIPRLTAAAAREHTGVQFLVTAPFGLHPLMAEVMRRRIEHCLSHTAGSADACELCAGTDRCQLRTDDAQSKPDAPARK
jgi:sirohydrochlorin ferrochelatase